MTHDQRSQVQVQIQAVTLKHQATVWVAQEEVWWMPAEHQCPTPGEQETKHTGHP